MHFPFFFWRWQSAIVCNLVWEDWYAQVSQGVKQSSYFSECDMLEVRCWGAPQTGSSSTKVQRKLADGEMSGTISRQAWSMHPSWYKKLLSCFQTYIVLLEIPTFCICHAKVSMAFTGFTLALPPSL